MERLLGSLSVKELMQGYQELPDGVFVCCLCGERFEPGQVYPIGERFYQAERAAELHVAAHGGTFGALLGLDKRYIGLTGNQIQLLQKMHEGLSDVQIAAHLGVSPSTVRHQRFMFREKAKQARAYLALFELSVGQGTPKGDLPVPVHAHAAMVDERYQVTQDEQQEILISAFESLDPLRLRALPRKEKKKIVVLRRAAELFEPGRSYTEKEVNARLREVYDDFAALRRYLVEYGFMARNADGSCYTRQTEGGIKA